MLTSHALRSSLFLSLLVGCAVPTDTPDYVLDIDESAPAISDDDAEPSPEEMPGQLALAPDPSGVTTHASCTYSYVWNGTSARVYHPAGSSGCTTSIHSPLVVILNGHGFSHTDYDYLGRHLARNGYTVASVNAVAVSNTAASHQAAADKAWAFVNDYLWTVWGKRAYIDPSRVGLIGHSRGGETVRYLAEKLKNNQVFKVKSVVALAPTNSTSLTLRGQNTLSAMVLVGANDPDTRAESAYAVHDKAGSDASQQDPIINLDALYRSMKMLQGANHAGFAANAAQGTATKGYVMAFLHAHLKNDITYYEDYVRGDAVPGGWAQPVTTQYRDGFLRRMIDNFEDGALANSTIGGFVSVGIGNPSSVIDLRTSADSPHETYALHYDPPATGGGFLWSIPAGKRDATLFKYLSVRVGQTSGAPTDDLRVRIGNTGVTSAWVRLTDHGTLPQPTNMCTSSQLGLCQTIASQNHMGTIRIPLSAFGAHNDVRWIELGAVNEAIQGRYLIDNLEFSEFVLKP